MNERTYEAEVISHKRDLVFLNIDLGFCRWHTEIFQWHRSGRFQPGDKVELTTRMLKSGRERFFQAVEVVLRSDVKPQVGLDMAERTAELVQAGSTDQELHRLERAV